MAKKTYKKKATAKRAKKRGQSIYKVKGGYRVSRRKKSKSKTRRRRRSWP